MPNTHPTPLELFTDTPASDIALETCGYLACTNTFDAGQGTPTEDDGEVCGQCIARHYVYSEYQATYIRRNDRLMTGDGECVSYAFFDRNGCHAEDGTRFISEYERDLYDSENSDSGHIYDYHETNNIDKFGWPAATPRNGLCFGVELEMENENGSQSELCEALGGRDGNGTYLLMRDGSLNDSGVEMITSPFTLEYHQNKFDWSKVLAPAITVGARSGKGTTACGMHVHINRRAISALTLGKMLVLVNHPNSSALIKRIAQRDGGHWARRMEKKISDGRTVRGEKYEALHLTERTIECRIFRGNLRAERILKNIEFCHALVSFCKQASIKDVEDYNTFLAWLGKNRATYPNLVQFLTEASYMRDFNNTTDKDI